jgi:hypothetical protein
MRRAQTQERGCQTAEAIRLHDEVKAAYWAALDEASDPEGQEPMNDVIHPTVPAAAFDAFLPDAAAISRERGTGAAQNGPTPRLLSLA